ncbi:hypothetical protein LXM60_17795 [Pandoraea sputorum]|uniref:hypothetical protein n=1 Tax=Pandoraea sputorum TaxID=93222 RepID=UPI001E415BB1|nr:hypothetical protein [Pandoraea sputorum]MCE4062049.1 hypothetical protein [Pandoraea sputorum]
MRRFAIVSLAVTAAFANAGCASDLSLHTPVTSRDLGMGDGMVITETQRTATDSMLQVKRLYRYDKTGPSAWGMPQSFTLYCAVRQIGADHGHRTARLGMLVKDDAGWHAPPPNQSLGEVGPDQMYVHVDWDGAVATNVPSGMTTSSLPLDGKLEKNCADIKARMERMLKEQQKASG